MNFSDVRFVSTDQGKCYKITDDKDEVLWWSPVNISYYKTVGTETEFISSETIYYGQDGHLPDLPQKIEPCWYINEWDPPCKKVTYDVSATMVYVQLYEVTYKTNIDGGSFKTERLAPSVYVNYPDYPTIPYYKFQQWNPERIEQLTSDTTVVAEYEKNQIIIEGHDGIFPYDEYYHYFKVRAKLNHDPEVNPTIEYSDDNKTWGKTEFKLRDAGSQKTIYYRISYPDYETYYGSYLFQIKEAETFDVVYNYMNVQGGWVEYYDRVSYGQASNPPQLPEPLAYTFEKWDSDFSHVTSNMDVKAEYQRRVLNCYVFSSLSSSNVCLTSYYEEPINPSPICEETPVDRYVFQNWYTYVNGVQTKVNSSEFTEFKQNGLHIYPYFRKKFYVNTYVISSSIGPIPYKSYTVLSGDNLEREDIDVPQIPEATLHHIEPNEWNPVIEDTDLVFYYSTEKIQIKYYDNIPVIIYLNGNGGELDLIHGKSQYSLYKDDNFPTLYDPSRSLYNFRGWSKDSQEGGVIIPTTGKCTFDIDTTLFAQWSFIDPSIINYFDSYNDWSSHTGNQSKKFQGGRYEVIAIGSGGSSCTRSSGTTYKHIYYTGHASGGSGCFIYGHVDIPGPFTQFTVNVSQHAGDTLFVSTNGAININADCGTDGSAPRALTMEKGYGGKTTSCNTTGIISGTLTLTGGSDGGDRTHYTLHPYDYPAADGAPYPRAGIDLGGGASSNGANHTTIGYLHVERFMEVTFLDQDGTIYKPLQYVRRNTNAVPPENPSKQYYDFKGWSKSYQNVTEDRLCYAVWEIQKVTVTFNSNGHGTNPPQQTVNCLEKVTRPTDPFEAGYLCVGWYKEAECQNVWDFDNDIVTGDVTLYAKWIENYFLITSDGDYLKTERNDVLVSDITVSFDVNGHGTAPSSQKVSYGGKVIKPTDPEETGFIFGGWFKESSCTTQWDFDNDVVTENKTLYAKWDTKPQEL